MVDADSRSRQPFVLAFESTHAAMAAQTAFSQTGRPFALIPTPREISAGCGMSLKFKAENAAAAKEFVSAAIEPSVAQAAARYEATGYTQVSRP